MADQLLRDLLDLPGRDPLHVHLRKRRNQRLLRALIALKQLGREPPLAILRNSQLQLVDPRDQRARVTAADVSRDRVAHPPRRAMPAPGWEALDRLGNAAASAGQEVYIACVG
jgi:hypothetical protein